MSLNPKIYVACLASYNSGVLYGDWIELEGLDYEDIQLQIDEIIKHSPTEGAEEWAVHDSEDLPNWLRNTEWPNPKELSEFVAIISSTDHDEDVIECAMTLACDNEELSQYLENFSGCYSSKAEWAEEFLESTGAFDGGGDRRSLDLLRQYFDYDSYARDVELGGSLDFVEYLGDCYVFHK